MSDNVLASVRATCARCGVVQVPAAKVHLVMARPDRDGDHRNVVEFACPVCAGLCSMRVDERTTRLVTAAGVALVAAPSEDPSPRSRSRGAPEPR
jgi:hypothetical protein